jgi:hypothetical protein
VFVADIGIYNKLINEEKFDEDFIPPFFIGKYYILKYLYENEYFDGENIKEPSKDIFMIYRELYDFITTEFKLKGSESEEFLELKNDFKNYLPDRQIKTDRQIFDTMNKKNSDNNENELFVEPTGYSDNEEISEDDSVDSEIFDIKTEKIIINKIKQNIEIYKNIKKNNLSRENFTKDYKVIDYLYQEGFFDDMDIDDSIIDYYCLYTMLLDYLNDKKIDNETVEIFNDELEKFRDFIQ